ncbi:MAG: DUF3592 domain-containing protein [Candidatus Omnitrophota bacterium]|nr:hypothetical protein [Candidatus Omnitrophota bacterium]
MGRKIFGIGFLLVGVILAAVAWSGHLQAKRIAQTGTHVMAVVTEKSTDASNAGVVNVHREVSYVFSVDGNEPVQSRSVISPGTWSNLVEGALIEVVFDPMHPRNNFPVDENKLVSPVTALITTMVAVFLCGMGIIILFAKSHTKGSCCVSSANSLPAQPKQ